MLEVILAAFLRHFYEFHQLATLLEASPHEIPLFTHKLNHMSCSSLGILLLHLQYLENFLPLLSIASSFAHELREHLWQLLQVQSLFHLVHHSSGLLCHLGSFLNQILYRII